MTINTFIPSSVSRDPHGRSSSPASDIYAVGRAVASLAAPLHERVYERSGESPALANPPFATSSAGRLNPAVASGPNASDPRILRGYIRRSVLDNSDATSPYRLYFMFNPTTVERTYVSYLDQLALDPFNTIFDAGNLVAPPGVLDFNFELFFDREIEVARQAGHRGVQVDLDYFERVVRGVEPGSDSGMPDNGLFLVNPRNITVVFSPHLVVEGRAHSSTISFDKFSHRMTPTRARVSISMKAMYIGPDKGKAYQLYSSSEVATHKATVPYDTIEVTSTYDEEATELTWDEVASSSSPTASWSGDPSAGGAAGGAEGGPSNFRTLWNNLMPGKLSWPVAAQHPITSNFGPRWGRMHKGVDIGCPRGTSVFAAGDGVAATTSGWGGGWGNHVIIDHGNVSGIGNLRTVYAHFQNGTPFAIANGQRVKRGDLIGFANNTGSSQGDHLHFETHVNGTAVDPLTLVQKP